MTTGQIMGSRTGSQGGFVPGVRSGSGYACRMDFEALGRQLKRLRQDAGLGQKEVGAKIGVSYWQIDNIESARRKVPIERLEQFAEAVGYRVEMDIVPASAEAPVYLSPELGSLAEAAADMSPEHQMALARLARVWGRLPGFVQRGLLTDIEEWEKEFPAEDMTSANAAGRR